MFGKIRRDYFLEVHRELREFCILNLSHDLCEGAKKHIRRGLIIRLAMMEEAILSLDSQVGTSNEPLDHYLAIKLTLFLNAYYLNLTGSLDNLAWALAYQYNLIDGINENFPKHRQKVQLINTKFFSLLKEKNLGSLCIRLEKSREWYKNIREFRDPFAHRIPLFVLHAVLSEEDVQQIKKLDEQAALLIEKGDYIGGKDLLRQSYSLGKHIPVFTTESQEIQLYNLIGRVNLDHEEWLKVVRSVLREGF
jgi:hypothetical protein